ncbi:hypothetical protein [Cohnella hongkongensis]|uniref:Uncharacterized protein n=1 Tax=Cohnella hongkongensis TaxID=178337 RepID=A0ABV9FHI1_9BACL
MAKWAQRALGLVLAGGLAAGTVPQTVGASGIGKFEVGGFWQPPIYVGGDYNTSSHYANITGAHIDSVVGVRVPQGVTLDKAANESGIAASHANGVKLYVSDSSISGKSVYTAEDETALENALLPYKNDSRVKAITLKDEPAAWELEGYANAYKKAKAFAPDMDVYVNLLPSYAGGAYVEGKPGKLVLSNSGARGSRSAVSSGSALGQTFVVPAGMTMLHGIELTLDPSSAWSSSETLTLKLWDGPAKTTLLGQASLTGSGTASPWTYHPYFTLNAPVTPGSALFMELTSNRDGGESGRRLSVSNEGAQQNGSYVTPTNRLGQTFKVPAGVTRIHGIDLFVDPNQWSSSETLTLKLWDGPAKTTLLGQASLTGGGAGAPWGSFPYFALNAAVTPGSTSYMELTHDGGGDNSVGWVVRSDANLYSDGTAYENGVAKAYDFFFRVYESTARLVVSNEGAQQSGSNVTPTASLGQTFKVPAGVTRIHGIDLFVDPNQWSSSETLTLKLWDGPAKTTLLGQASLTGGGAGAPWGSFPYFALNAAVTPGSTSYMELTHDGGGDNSVGWVVRSDANLYSDGTAYENGVAKAYDFFFRVYEAGGTNGTSVLRSDTNVYADGAAYENGGAKPYDLNFKLYANRDVNGTPYENYLDDWLEMSGADEIIADNYTFRNGYDEPSYFSDAEAIRSRALAHDALYGGFLLSLGLQNNQGQTVFRAPTMGEMRWNVYTYLTYGFKKLIWFTYWQPDPAGGEHFLDAPVDMQGNLTARYAQIQTLNAEMQHLGETLKDLTSVSVYHTGATLPLGTWALPASFFVQPTDSSRPLVIGYFTHASGRKYVMLTNRDYTNANTVDFVFNPKPATLTEISKATGLETAVPGYVPTTGGLTITLQPGEGRLFALPQP